jgi:hypothetical protein
MTAYHRRIQTMRRLVSRISAALCTGVLAAFLSAVPVFAANVNIVFVTPYGNYITTVPQGSNAEYHGPTDINVSGFAFCGWDVSLSNVQHDMVATAVYLPIGSSSQTTDVCNTYHNLPTGVLSYSTAGDNTLHKATTTSPYPATPISTPCRLSAQDSIRQNPVGVPGRTCVVKWYNGSSGELWYTDVVAYGSSLTPPEDPCIDGLEFIGWDGSWTNITSDRNIIGCFYRCYKVLYVCADCGELLASKNLRITDDLQLSARSVNTEGHPWPDEWDEHWVSNDKVILVGDPHPKHNDYYGDDDNHSHKYDNRKWVEMYR